MIHTHTTNYGLRLIAKWQNQLAWFFEINTPSSNRDQIEPAVALRPLFRSLDRACHPIAGTQ